MLKHSGLGGGYEGETVFVIAVPLVLVVLRTNGALAAGAIAEGIAPGGPQKGYAIGIVTNLPDEDAAKASAIDACKKLGNAAAQKQCHVVSTFTDRCGTVVQDPEDGTPGVGWAVAATLAAADEQAITRCKSTAGPDRQNFCTDIVHKCDGSAK